MKTGNAILMSFFVWMALYLPIKILSLSETYHTWEFADVGCNEWMIFSFLICFLSAVAFGICGIEKRKNIYYKKNEDKQIDNEEDHKEEVAGFDPIEKYKEKQETPDIKEVLGRLEKMDPDSFQDLADIIERHIENTEKLNMLLDAIPKFLDQQTGEDEKEGVNIIPDILSCDTSDEVCDVISKWIKKNESKAT